MSSLKSPQLDDRTFAQLVEQARSRIPVLCPEWTDLSPSDPGIILLELFAYLTETMLFRLNRIPEKAYIEFLQLMGVRLHPPSAARVTLRFTRSKGSEAAIEIPRGTRVTVGRTASAADAPVFVTSQTVTISPRLDFAEVTAYHAEAIEGELAGKGTGLPGLSVQAAHPPIIAPADDQLDFVLGVEAQPELDERVPAVLFRGKTYRIWREVENFSNLGPDRYVYVLARSTGTAIFAPAVRRELGQTLSDTPEVLAEAPPVGAEIRLWYRRGGGLAGNVAANTLTKLKDSIPGVDVTNETPAMGGRAAETLENAILRGPQSLHSLNARLRGAILRYWQSAVRGRLQGPKRPPKRCFGRSTLSGTVEVIIVPFIHEEARSGGRIPVQQISRDTRPNWLEPRFRTRWMSASPWVPCAWCELGEV